MRIVPSESLQQSSEYWESTRGPATVLTQQKQATSKRRATTFQNLIYVCGKDRPDQFQIKRVLPTSLLVKGKTAQANIWR